MTFFFNDEGLVEVEAMSEGVFDAELVETGDIAYSENFLKSGRMDISGSRLFRYTWFFGVYIAFALPYAFYNQWALTVGVNDYGLDKDLMVPLFMATQIPFFLRPVWGSQVDRRTGMGFGRRRSWIILGIIGHIALLIPLAFIPISSAPMLWVGMLALALIPRVFAEQGIAGLMVDYLPDPGAIGAAIAYAFRIGASVIPGLIIMGWWIGGVPMDSPFLDDLGEVDLNGVLFGANILIAVGLVGALLLALLMKEGEKVIRGSGDSGPVATTVEEAEQDPKLLWPEGTSVFIRLKAAFASRTARLCLLVALLVPLGDGFETWFRYYFLEDLGWSTSRWAGWSWLFVAAGFLGLIGPAISDFVDRRRVLMFYSICAMVSYILLGVSMFTGASWQVILTAWVFVLITTDWLIFTFMASIIEVADPRIASTHMGVYQATQAISSTILMVLLGQFILSMTDGSYGTLYLLAALGPLIGYLLFKEMQLPRNEDRSLEDLRDRLVSFTDGILSGSAAYERMAPPNQGRTRATVWLISGAILMAGIGGLAAAFNVEYSESEEYWKVEIIKETTILNSPQISLGEGDTGSHSFNWEGGPVESMNIRVAPSSCSSTIGQPSYSFTLTAPTMLKNEQSDSVQKSGSGELTFEDDTLLEPLQTAYEEETEEQLREAVNETMGSENWSIGQGSWDVEITRNGGTNPLSSCQFDITLTLNHYSEPAEEMYVYDGRVSTMSKDFGPAFLTIVGGPVILAIPVVAWLVSRP